MNKVSDIKFAKLIWKDRLWEQSQILKTVDGVTVIFKKFGDYDESSDMVSNCELILGSTTQTGIITFTNQGYMSELGVILQVVTCPTERLCNEEGDIIPQLVLPIDERVRKFYSELLRSSAYYDCGHYISSLDSCFRINLMTRLVLERMERKHGELMEIHREGDNNWNNTLYIMLFGAMGAPKNKKPFISLAKCAKYDQVSHEKGNPAYVEAMLLGASGLLQQIESNDQYIREMRSNFIHLQNKYAIMPMHHSEWSSSGRPNGKAAIRILQLAAFLANNDFVFDNIIKCRNVEDIRKLFSAQIDDKWITLFQTSHIGDQRKDVIGINFVVSIIFAYAQVMDDEKLAEVALELMDKIPAEHNKIVDTWGTMGIPIKSAFDSQAVIQLTNEYCSQKRCAECIMGKLQIREKFNTITK